LRPLPLETIPPEQSTGIVSDELTNPAATATMHPRALPYTVGGWSHHPKGGEAMRVTLHIGNFTVTIVVKKRENRHPGR